LTPKEFFGLAHTGIKVLAQTPATRILENEKGGNVSFARDFVW